MRVRAGLLAGIVALGGACGGQAEDDSGEGASGGSSPGSGGSTGGTAGTGGGIGSGGGIATGGSGACEEASVVFRAKPDTPTGFCADTCGLGWISIFDPHGEEIPLTSMCQTSCDVCEPLACIAIACPEPSELQGPIEFTWRGFEYLQSTCGDRSTSCYERRCAEPGTYRARVCLRRTSPDGCDMKLEECEEIEFTWPSNEEIDVGFTLLDTR